jgi:hypothetical protein
LFGNGDGDGDGGGGGQCVCSVRSVQADGRRQTDGRMNERAAHRTAGLPTYSPECTAQYLLGRGGLRSRIEGVACPGGQDKEQQLPSCHMATHG